MGYHDQHNCRSRRRHCGCDRRGKEIVYPTKEKVVHRCSEEVVRHVHPVHTTVVNHHRVRNEHVYPHSRSEVDSIEEYDVGRRRRRRGNDNVLGTSDCCNRNRRRHCGCRRRRRGCFW